MIVIENGLKVNPAEVEKKLTEAESLLGNVNKVLNKSDINKLIENMSNISGNFELAIAMGSLNENLKVNDYIVKFVVTEDDSNNSTDKKPGNKLSLSRRREIARKAARSRMANPAAAKAAEEKRQVSRNANKEGNERDE